MIPIISIVIFSTYSFIQLWIGQNVEIISISSILIVSTFMIAITVMPNYLYLIAKDKVEKTIVMQLSNVFFNCLIFFATLKWLGYYAAVAGNVTAIFVSFSLSLYYQRKYLNSLIFDSFEQIGKLIVLAFANISLGYLLSLLITSDWVKVVSIPLVLAISSLYLFRYLNFFSEEDILRYAGSNKRASELGLKIFCNR
jgi:O-antigen/teichoic acid export membrane protein